MNVQDVIGVHTGTARTSAAELVSPPRQAAFVTPQSLSTFPAASGAVFLMWAVLKVIWPGTNQPWVALVIALVVGALIVVVNFSTTDARPRGVALLGQVCVAIVNAFLLAASALGITIVTGGSSTGWA